MKQKRGMFFVVLVFSLLIFSLNALAAGCYTYPGADEAIFCQDVELAEATADCEQFSDCEIGSEFEEGTLCSEPEFQEQCGEVLCKVDCQTHALGWCQKIGQEDWGIAGEEVQATEQTVWCNPQPGCCSFVFPQSGQTFCAYGQSSGASQLTRWVCEARASQSGVTNPIFVNDVDENECRQNLCRVGVSTRVSITGVVFDANEDPIPGATVTVQGGDSVTATSGSYTIPNLGPGTYQLRAEATGFSSSLATVRIVNESVSQNFTLSVSQGEATIQGTVQSAAGSIANARVALTGPTGGTVTSGENGQYQTQDIPPGEYQIRVTADGFDLLEETHTVQLGENSIDFLLVQATFQGITGSVYRDSNENLVRDQGDQPNPAATILVDGRFRAFSRHPNGNYGLRLDPGTYTIQATFSELQSDTHEVIIADGSITMDGSPVGDVDMLLIRSSGVCTPGNELPIDADAFALRHMPGEEAVELRWRKPCPEVLGYRISRTQGDSAPTILSGTRRQVTKIDEDVEWGKTYTYSIVVSYNNGESTAVESSITLGNANCAGKYRNPGGWQTFCLSTDAGGNPATVYICSDQNALNPLRDCSTARGPSFYCAPVSETAADCKDAGICGSSAQQADPFGLYHNSRSCYGTSDPTTENAVNFCYFDSTLSPVNVCKACPDIQTCFDYRGQEACDANSCFTESCKWINGASNANPAIIDYGNLLPGSLPLTEETGTGFCIQEDYTKSDQCSRCGPQGDLFENNYCTAEICAGLGKCFSNSPTGAGSDLSYCASCPETPEAEANCYTYNTQLECTGGTDTSRDEEHLLSFSEDSCRWQRCRWGGASDEYNPNGCFKDADGDGQDDCADSSFFASERESCRVDMTPPVTTIEPAGVKVLSQSRPSLDFHSVDADNQLGVLEFCLSSASSPTGCTTFHEAAYDNTKTDDTLEVDLLRHLPEGITGETYKLVYHSKDKYMNQEQRKEEFVFVDNVAPQFRIRNRTTTTEDSTNFFVFLERLREPMSCSFTLSPVHPPGSSRTITADRNAEQKEARFDNLRGVIYDLNVTCTDEVGNENSETRTYTFDLEQSIDIVHPPLMGAVAERSIAFEVETDVGSTCELFDINGGTPIMQFEIQDQEGKKHKTQAIPNFVEGEYAARYKVVCEELLTGESNEDFFHFFVDFTPPNTKIILTEGSRRIEPATSNWEESFIRFAQVDFECDLDDLGFSCDKTKYCTGSECTDVRSTRYKEYTGSLNVTSSTNICYYSTDSGGSRVFSATCGQINIDGYGIKLEHPGLHRFKNKMWGVSSQPLFDLVLSTRIPTVECRVDFSPRFDYQSVEAYKIKSPSANNRYRFSDFPESFFTSYDDDGGVKDLYVKCIDGDGEISPEQPISIEYDPTAPRIKDAGANPDPVIEGSSTQVFVETDDKTLCKYSDNTTGQGSPDYDTMEFSFPGSDRKELKLKHQDNYAIEFIGSVQEFYFLTQCRNGAGNLSETEKFSFTVDYSQRGNIINVSPSGEYYTVSSIPIRVVTSKNAVCQRKVNDTYVNFDTGSNTRVHDANLANLEEKEYIIPVRCRMGDTISQAQIKFTIDRSPPVISNVEDGNNTCGEDINVFITTNEEHIQKYTYELYEGTVAPVRRSRFRRGSSNVTPPRAAGSAILSGEAVAQLPIKIPTAQLKNETTYIVRVTATDGVGLTSPAKESNGVLITSKNYSVCEDDKAGPKVEIITDETCTSIGVGLSCSDATACDSVRYGVGASAKGCSPTKRFNGEKIMITKSQWICYNATDVTGQSRAQNRKIIFSDEDGDGVKDNCDNCTGTGPGKIVDGEGCAAGEFSGGDPDSTEDSDNDGLPNLWERLFNSVNCLLDEALEDSDLNGVSDGVEDYDNDGKNNIEEYQSNTDPCSADQRLDIPEGDDDDDDDDPFANDDDDDDDDEDKNLLPLILLISGLVLMLGGTGYLIYYYKSTPSSAAKPVSIKRTTGPSPIKPAIIPQWKKRFIEKRKAKQEKKKERKRRSLFGSFGASEETPKSEEVKPEAKPKTKPATPVPESATPKKVKGEPKEDKGIFGKLESLAKKTKPAKAEPKKEDKDVFSKLKDMGKKKKKK